MRQSRGAFVLLAAFAAATFVLEAVRPTQAMPPFAQAYGMNCEVCHTAVPALNAYGRYILRTGFGSLDAGTIHHVDPFWVGEQVLYDTQSETNPHKFVFGNLALHAAGYLGSDITFHLHQWWWEDNEISGTDTMWLTYNNLFHRDGHLFIGKIEAPAPAPYSQWFELSGFAPAEITVGDHEWQLGENRWGAKLSYGKEHHFFGEIAWLGNNGDLNTATDFSSNIDKTFQWRLGYGRGDRPVEAGLYGSVGSVPISDGTLDHYNSIAFYVQADPQKSTPGALAIYQVGHDANPAPGLGAATSKAYSLGLYEQMFQNHAMLGVRTDMADDGLGTVTHSVNVDLQVTVFQRVTPHSARGLFLTGEAGMMPGSTPAWRGQLLFATSL